MVEVRAHSTTIYGKSLDEIVEKAQKEFAGFYGSQSFQIDEIVARPEAQTVYGEIMLWAADVEASACFP